METNEKKINVRIGKRIAEARKNLYVNGKHTPLSQLALAQACGITRSALGRVERGDNPIKPSQLILICHHLNITPNDIFCRSISERFMTETFVGMIFNKLLARVIK